MTGDFFLNSDNLLEIKGLKNEASGAYLNSASIDVTCKDADTGTEISGVSWPLTMSYVADSDGDYQLTIPDTASLTLGKKVRIEAVSDSGPNLKRTFVETVSVIEELQA